MQSACVSPFSDIPSRACLSTRSELVLRVRHRSEIPGLGATLRVMSTPRRPQPLRSFYPWRRGQAVRIRQAKVTSPDEAIRGVKVRRLFTGRTASTVYRVVH
jgi:hypothetical protein